MTTVDFAEAHARFAELWNQVIENREPVIITRSGHKPVAMIAADELESLLETVHLLRSPANAERLLESLARAKAGMGTPTDIEMLRVELGFGDA